MSTDVKMDLHQLRHLFSPQPILQESRIFFPQSQDAGRVCRALSPAPSRATPASRGLQQSHPGCLVFSLNSLKLIALSRLSPSVLISRPNMFYMNYVIISANSFSSVFFPPDFQPVGLFPLQNSPKRCHKAKQSCKKIYDSHLYT